MPMNMTRTASAGAIGVVSGVLSSPSVVKIPLDLGGTKISWGTVAEAVAVVGGSMAQYFMPFTAPNIVDGLVDGGIALLGRRGGEYAAAQLAGGTAAGYAVSAARVAPMMGAGGYGGGYPALPAPSYARGAIGAISRTPRVQIT